MQREVDRDDTAPARSDGAPTDPVTSDERPAESGHGPIAQLLIAWSQLSVILLPYALAGWISAPLGAGGGADTSRLGFVVNVAGPAEADRGCFGALPSASSAMGALLAHMHEA